MAWKLALNVFYTIAIVACLLVAYKGYTSGQFFYILGGLFVAGVVLIFKIKLLREVRQRKP